MDPDRLQMIVDAVQGMDAGQIQELLEGSAHAADIQNAPLLAAYLAAQSG